MMYQITGDSVFRLSTRNIQFQHYWCFVRGIHRWSVDSPHKGPAFQSMTSPWTVGATRPPSLPCTSHIFYSHRPRWLPQYLLWVNKEAVISVLTDSSDQVLPIYEGFCAEIIYGFIFFSIFFQKTKSPGRSVYKLCMDHRTYDLSCRIDLTVKFCTIHVFFLWEIKKKNNPF